MPGLSRHTHVLLHLRCRFSLFQDQKRLFELSVPQVHASNAPLWIGHTNLFGSKALFWSGIWRLCINWRPKGMELRLILRWHIPRGHHDEAFLAVVFAGAFHRQCAVLPTPCLDPKEEQKAETWAKDRWRHSRVVVTYSCGLGGYRSAVGWTRGRLSASHTFNRSICSVLGLYILLLVPLRYKERMAIFTVHEAIRSISFDLFKLL